MPSSRSHRLTAVALFLTLALAGCDAGSAPPVPVRGTVAYRGAPLRGGTIVFTPDAGKGTRGGLAQAEIQPDGSYALRTADTTGAVPGWHRVTVLAVLPPGPPLGPGFAVPPSLLPERYRDPDLSGLVREVKAGAPNTINFDLE